MIILVILLVIQPMVGRLLATEGPQLEEDLEAQLLTGRPLSPALEGPDTGEDFEPPSLEDDDSMIDMQQVEGKVKASSIRKVEDIVENYPSETVSVLRSWMSSET
jgi:flagellar M-ring protein FliF